jgi:hypothetical protein
MIITRDDLEKVCNYTENSKPSLPKGIIAYLDMVEEPNEEYKRELKRKNRELAIDAVLDNKVDEFKNRESFLDPLENEGFMSTISAKVMSVNATASKFIDNNQLFSEIILKLESLTLKPMNIPQSLNLIIQNDPSLTHSENEMANSRKLMSKITMLSNLIAKTSRRGPANSMIVGLEAYKYILLSNSNSITLTNDNKIVTGNMMGINIIPSPYIKPNKIIMMKTDKQSGGGLNVVRNVNDSTYFMVETPNSWDKSIHWFEII